MDTIFYTLYDFLAYTKGVLYVLVVICLLSVVGFWFFLTGRDEEDET